jgi:hypothetical protein
MRQSGVLRSRSAQYRAPPCFPTAPAVGDLGRAGGRPVAVAQPKSGDARLCHRVPELVALACRRVSQLL